jgi:hypothetical protein
MLDDNSVTLTTDSCHFHLQGRHALLTFRSDSLNQSELQPYSQRHPLPVYQCAVRERLVEGYQGRFHPVARIHGSGGMPWPRRSCLSSGKLTKGQGRTVDLLKNAVHLLRELVRENRPNPAREQEPTWTGCIRKARCENIHGCLRAVCTRR